MGKLKPPGGAELVNLANIPFRDSHLCNKYPHMCLSIYDECDQRNFTSQLRRSALMQLIARLGIQHTKENIIYSYVCSGTSFNEKSSFTIIS